MDRRVMRSSLQVRKDKREKWRKEGGKRTDGE